MKKIKIQLDAEKLRKKLNIKDGENGKDGVSPNVDDIINGVASKLATEIPTKVEEIETPEKIVEKLESLEGEDRLDKSAVKGLEDYDEVSKLARNRGGGLTRGVADSAYLNIDQTTPQTVQSGSPIFAAGLTIKTDQWVYLDG